MKKHSKILVLLLSFMMVFTLIPTTAFAEGDGSAVTPELVSETLWAGTESWSSPHFSNIDANNIDVISVSSSDTGVLNVECYGDSTNILNYILFPGNPGTAVITVTFTLDGEEYTVSGEYKVKAFPVFLSSLYIDGEAISAEDYNYHNFYDIEDYEGTSPNVQFTVAEGWNFDNAYYNRSLNNGNFEEIFLGENLPEEGWTFDFSDDYNKLNTFYVFRSDEGEKIQFGIRFTKSEGGVDPGDETVLDTIEITNINTELIPGEKAEFTTELLSDNMTIVNERWFRTDQGKILTGWSEDLPEAGEEYIYFITVRANDGYKFADNPTVKYNGEVVGAVITADNETDISIGDIIPSVTVTAQERITAVYERVTPFEVIMERDLKDYGDGLQYVGKPYFIPDKGDKVTFTFPDGSVKKYTYNRSESLKQGEFVNYNDSSDVINYKNIYINLLDQAYDWAPGGDKNYYEVSFIDYPDVGADIVTCRVPVEVSSTPVASVEYEPVPRLRFAADAKRSSIPRGNKVTVTYKDGTVEVFVDDYKCEYISQTTMEPLPYNVDSFFNFSSHYDPEDLSETMTYMGVTSEKNYTANYVAQSISLYQEEPMVLIKGKNSDTLTDAAGNEYEKYGLYSYNLFGENDVLTITYKNGLGETIDVDYADISNNAICMAEDSPYYTPYGEDVLWYNNITINMPDQSENHFEIGQTYSMDITYHAVDSSLEYAAFTTEGEPYKVLIKEAGPEDVTSVSFTSGSSIAKVKKGETLQMAVSWEPSYANVPADAITWVSTNPSVATIDGNGLVTAVSEGSTQITAQIGDRIADKNVEVYEEKILTDETVSLSQTVFPYTGTTVNVDGCVLYNGEPVPRTYCSFNYTAIGAEGQPPREIGDYKVVITGSYGGYSGSATEYFTIKGDLTRNATNLNVTLNADEYVYSGSPVEPEIVSITAKGKGGGIATLVEGQDYTVSYMNNTAAGTGFVIISAIEDSYYRGEKMIPFTITEAVKDGWIREGDDWYYYENGNMVTSKWRKDGDDWCYLGPDGKRVSSKWQKDSKGWCYLGADGKMVTNDWVKDTKGYCWIAADGYMPNVTKWIQYEGSWYHITNGYRDESKWMKDSKGWCWLQADGKMLTNGWAKDSKGYCWIGANGYMVTDTKWIDADGTRYYIKSGYMAVNCWAKDDTGWLYLGADGQPVKNTWKKDSKGWCYVGEDGYMIANGWAKDSKGWCWLASDGYMPVETKWVKYEGDWYHITNGYRDESKWMKDSKGWCWLQADGKMLTNGWAKDSKGWCWLAANGYMPVETGWVEYEGDKYYIEKGYRAESKWLELDGHKFYLKEDGRMAHDEVVTIDGIQYLFDENGYFVGAVG